MCFFLIVNALRFSYIEAVKPLKRKEKVMSTATLTNLRDYLTGTLSPANMLWLSTQLADFAKKKEKAPLKRYTMDEINTMLDEAEADFAAGKGIPDEEVWRELEDEFPDMEKDLYTPEEAYELTMKEIKAIYDEKDAI